MLHGEYPWAPLVALGVFSAMAVIGPWAVGRRPNRRDTQYFIVITALNMFVLHMTVYMAQMNPSFGPALTRETIEFLAHKWGRPVKQLPPPPLQLTVSEEMSSASVCVWARVEQSVSEVSALVRAAWLREHGRHVLAADQYLQHGGEELHAARTLASYRLRPPAHLIIVYRPYEIVITKESSTLELRVAVKPYYSVGSLLADIRRRWRARHGEAVLANDQYLTFQRNLLEDSHTMAHYHIQPGSVLLIKYKLINLKVTLEGSEQSVSVFVKPWYSVAALQETIDAHWLAEHRAHVLTAGRFLTYRDQPLDRARTLADHRIPPGGTLTVLYEPYHIEVQLEGSSKRVFLSVKAWYLVQFVKDALRDKWQAQYGANVLTQNQYLTYEHIALESQHSLMHYGIQEGNVLLIEDNELSVVVRMFGTDMEVSAPTKDKHSISELKTVIRDKWKSKHKFDVLTAESSSQRLTYEDRELADDGTVGGYHIQNGSVLFIRPEDIQMFVTIDSSDRQSAVTAKAWERISAVKERIRRQWELEHRDHVLGGTQILTYHNKALYDDNMVSDYHIRSGAILRIESAQFDVVARVEWAERNVTISVKPWYSVRKVAAMIRALWAAEYEEEVLTDHHYLTYEHVTLDEEASVTTSRIMPNATLLVQHKRRGIVVRLENSTDSLPVAMKPWQSIRLLQQQIRAEWKSKHHANVLTADQYLTFMDSTLQEERTIGESHIEEGSTLLIRYENIEVVVTEESSEYAVSLAVKPWLGVDHFMELVREQWEAEHDLEVLTPDQYITYNHTTMLREHQLSHYNIKSGSICLIKYKSINIIVTIESSEQNISMSVKPWHTFSRVGADIRDRWKKSHLYEVLNTEQYLTFTDIELQEDKLVSYYNIQEGSTLVIRYRKINVAAAIDSSAYRLRLQLVPYERVSAVVAAIRHQWQASHHVAVLNSSEQYLSHSNQTMDGTHQTMDGTHQTMDGTHQTMDGAQRLSHYGVRTGATLTIQHKQFQLSARIESSSLSVPLSVKSWYSVSRTKASLRDRWRASHNSDVLTTPDQFLTFKDDTLKDDRQLRDYNIQQGDVLLIKHKQMEIWVCIEDGAGCVSVRVQSWWSIGAVKEAVRLQWQEEHHAAVLTPTQSLTFMAARLRDEDTVAHCNISANSTLTIAYKRINVYAAIECSSDRVSLSLKQWHSLRRVKAAVRAAWRAAHGCEVLDQHQYLTYRDRTLGDDKDDQLVSAYAFEEGDKLLIKYKPIKVSVTIDSSSRNVSLEVKWYQRMLAVKREVRARWKAEHRDHVLAEGMQSLRYMRRGTDDARPVAYYLIRDNDVLHITHTRIYIAVTAEWSKDKVTLSVRAFHSIGRVKEAVRALWQASHHVAVLTSDQELTLRGRQLEDHQLVQYYSIQSGTTLLIRQQEVQVAVWLESQPMQHVSLRVSPWTSVSSLAALIRARWQAEHRHSVLDPDADADQTLTLHGEALHHAHQLRDYDVHVGSVCTLLITYAPIHLSVSAESSSRSVAVSVRRWQSVAALRQTVRREWSEEHCEEVLTDDEQSLAHSGALMDDRELVSHYKLKSGDNLLIKQKMLDNLLIERESNSSHRIQCAGCVTRYVSIRQLKERCRSEWGADALTRSSQEYMTLTGADEPLDDDRVLAYYHVPNSAHILVRVWKINITVFVETAAESVWLWVPAYLSVRETLQAARARWRTLHSADAFARYPGQLTAAADSADTYLDPDRKLSHYHIATGSTLTYRFDKVQMTVRLMWSQQHVVLSVSPWHRVRSLRAIIRRQWRAEHQTDVLTPDHVLTYHGTPLHDDQRLSDFNPNYNASQTELVIEYVKIKVLATIDAGSHSADMNLDPYQTISKLKTDLRVLWNEKYKYEVLTAEQYLTYEDIILDDQYNVAHYKIRTGDRLSIQHKTISLNIMIMPLKPNHGNKLTIEVKRCFTVEFVKDKIYAEHGGALSDDFNLQRGWNPLQNQNDLKKYNIKDGDFLFEYSVHGHDNISLLFYKNKKYNYQRWWTFEADVDTIEYVRYISEKVNDKFENYKKNRLEHNGRDLEDGVEYTLLHYKLKHDAKINVWMED